MHLKVFKKSHVLNKLMQNVNVTEPVDIDKENENYLKSLPKEDKKEIEEIEDPYAEEIAKINKAEMTKPFVRHSGPYS